MKKRKDVLKFRIMMGQIDLSKSIKRLTVWIIIPLLSTINLPSSAAQIITIEDPMYKNPCGVLHMDEMVTFKATVDLTNPALKYDPDESPALVFQYASAGHNNADGYRTLCTVYMTDPPDLVDYYGCISTVLNQHTFSATLRQIARVFLSGKEIRASWRGEATDYFFTHSSRSVLFPRVFEHVETSFEEDLQEQSTEDAIGRIRHQVIESSLEQVSSPSCGALPEPNPSHALGGDVFVTESDITKKSKLIRRNVKFCVKNLHKPFKLKIRNFERNELLVEQYNKTCLSVHNVNVSSHLAANNLLLEYHEDGGCRRRAYYCHEIEGDRAGQAGQLEAGHWQLWLGTVVMMAGNFHL